MDTNRATPVTPSSRSSNNTGAHQQHHLQQPLLAHTARYRVPQPPPTPTSSSPPRSNTNNNSSSPSSPPPNPPTTTTPPPPPFLSTPYYTEWYRSLDRSTRVAPSILKFLFQFVLYITELGSLVSSLFIGLIVPVFGGDDDGDGTHQFLETATAVIFFILTGFVSVWVRRSNSLHTTTTTTSVHPPPPTTTNNAPSSSNNNRFSPPSSKPLTVSSPSPPHAHAQHRSGCSNTPLLLDLLLTSLTLVKPIRYLNVFLIRRQKLHTIRTMGRQRQRVRDDGSSSSNVVEITEPGLVCLTEITAAEVEDARVVLYATYFQSIPVALLQLIFLFVSHQQFTLCNLQDLSRIGLLLTTIFTAAKASASYESAVHSHEASLHFLSFYRTEGANPMRIYPNDLLSIMGTANLINHIATIASRTYNTLFFASVSPWLCPLVPVTTYVLNLGLTRLLPFLTLPVYENAPFGVSTSPSHYADRYVNVFSNALTRFNKLHHVELRVPCTQRLRTIHLYLPIALLQVFHFAIPVLLVGLIVSYQVGGHDDFMSLTRNQIVAQSTTTPTNSNMMNDTLSDRCPDLGDWYSASPVFRKLGDSLFSSYRSVDDRLGTFNDLFSGTAMIWLLFYVQVVFGIVYAYADLMRRRRDPSTLSPNDAPYFDDVYPIAAASAFYSTLFSRALLGGEQQGISTSSTTTIKDDLRKLMLLTILRPLDFYWFTRRNLTPKRVIKKARSLTKRLDESDTEINDIVKFLLKESPNPWTHRVHTALTTPTTPPPQQQQHAAVQQEQLLQSDLRLFVIFFSLVDRKMYLLTSDRLRRVFHATGLKEPVKTKVMAAEE